ncbi:MAG TPA: thioesterase family protein [Micromonosporaceae bacterium]
MAGFDEATRVEAAGDGTYRAQLDPEWTVGGRPHGGYLLALVGRAVLAVTADHPQPLSASAVYASSPEVGPATVSVEVIRAGRLASQVRARLSQQGRVRVEALFVTGALEEAPEARFADAPPPAVAPIEECTRLPMEPMGPGFRIAMLDMVAQHIDPASFADARADMRGWLAFDDRTGAGEPDIWRRDTVSLLYAADAFPPPTLTLGSIGWVPTLELTAYLRSIPAPGPLRIRQRSRLVAGGLVDIVCEAWDSLDRVVVQATQLAAVRMPTA